MKMDSSKTRTNFGNNVDGLEQLVGVDGRPGTGRRCSRGTSRRAARRRYCCRLGLILASQPCGGSLLLRQGGEAVVELLQLRVSKQQSANNDGTVQLKSCDRKT